MSQCAQWVGFHGTSVLNASSIMSTQFRVSSQERDWLGTGVYFFVDALGLLPPVEKAEQWANFRARSASPRYSALSVLEVSIETGFYLDLDDEQHIAALNVIKTEYMEVMKREGRTPTGNRLKDKCAFCNFVMHEHGVDALVRREYIKTTDFEDMYGLEGGVPNCRVLCVKDPAASIKNVSYAVARRNVR